MLRKRGSKPLPPKITDADPPGTLTILPEYILLPGMTAQPTSTPGALYYRSDKDRIVYVDAYSTEHIITRRPIRSEDIDVDVITSYHLADGAVETENIADGAVTTPKLADSAVSTAKIKDKAVTGSKIADSSIYTIHIRDAAITTEKIMSRAITSDLIADGAVVTRTIADGAVTDAKITGPISPGKIGQGDLNLGTGTLYCGKVQVGHIGLKYGWMIRETPNSLLFIKDGRIVARLHKDLGFIHMRKGILSWLLRKIMRKT